jgi:hypothetical protein
MVKICAIAYFSIARPALARLLRDTEAGIRLNEHVAAGDSALLTYRSCLPIDLQLNNAGMCSGRPPHAQTTAETKYKNTI